MNVQSALSAYSNSNAAEIEKASAHKLIVYTFTELRQHLNIVNIQLKKNAEVSDTSVAKVLLALSILTDSLDLEKGGEIAKNLSDIYAYCRNKVALVFKGNEGHDLEDTLAIITSLSEACAPMAPEQIK